MLGTVNYMSPEQARGDANLTAQSDQFALGLVLYELAAGKRAFQRQSAAETMAAIIRDEAEPLPPPTPAPLRWIIERLLAKDAAERYDSTRDLYRELRQIRDRFSDATSASNLAPDAPARIRNVRPGVILTAGLVAGGLVAGAAMWRLGAIRGSDGSGADLSSYRFAPIATEPSGEWEPAWSPDGTSIAYVANVNGLRQVFTRSVGSSDAAQITQSPGGASSPSWSPDGTTIYFSSGGALWAVGSAGGTPDRIFERAGSYTVHSDGKTILFQRSGGLWIGARGEEPRPWDLPKEIADELLARGRLSVLGTSIAFSPDCSKVAVLTGADVWLLPYPAGEARRLAVADVQAASWMPDSRRLVLTRIPGPESHTLSMLDTVTGNHRMFYASPEALTSAVVSRDGKRLAYDTGRLQWHLIEIAVADGRMRTLRATFGMSLSPAWAPAGASYLFAVRRGERWGIDAASATERLSRRVVEVSEGGVNQPQWAPDGSQFTFLWERPVGGQLMLSNTSGRTAPLDPGARGRTADAVWAADGSHVIYTRVDGQTLQVARARPGSSASPEVLASYGPDEAARRRIPVALSPAGDWLLTRSGGPQPALVLVAPDFTRERPLTARPLRPVGFSKDGREVFGMLQDTSGGGAWHLWAVDVATGRERRVAAIDFPAATQSAAGFSLHPDGTRFATSIQIWPSDIWMLEGFDR